MDHSVGLSQAYAYFLERILSGEHGVFFAVRNHNGTQQFCMGFQSPLDQQKENDITFFWTDFLGTESSQKTFEEVYENEIPKDGVDIVHMPYNLPGDLATLSNETQATFEVKVRDIIKEARDGNVWVLNLAHKLKGANMPHEAALTSYARFLDTDAPHCGGVWWTKDTKFVSFSPETFLEQNKDTIDTYPIKGTGTLEYLKESAKEKAELLMVTDLLRNDLGQVASTVTVPTVRGYAEQNGFWHAFAHIKATLPSSRLRWDEYTKLLPAGSVSGSPKHRVVELIKDTEAEARDLYCGTFGIRKNNGQYMRANILIRTLFWNDDQTWIYGAGGGITHKSEPHKEWDETLTKAKILQKIFS